MKACFSIVLLFVVCGAVAAVTVSSSSSSNGRRIRGGPEHQLEEEAATTTNNNNNNKNKNVRRVLLSPDKECVLYLRDTQWEDRHKDPGCWVCSLNFADVEEDLFNEYNHGGEEFTNCITGIEKEKFDRAGIVSGGAVLKGAGLVVEESTEDENHMLELIVEPEASYEVEAIPERDPRHYLARRRMRRNLVEEGTTTSMHHGNNSRQLAPTTGTLSTLVVRVVAPNTPEDGEVASVEQLVDDVFTDSVSLKTQYAGCSKDQLIIEPANEGDGTGIVTINIDVSPGSGSTALQSAAAAEATNVYGNLASNYDLVMFCLPGGSGNWIAYAYLNSYLSVYNNFWCQRVSAQVHEVGHNLGLDHSNEGSVTYGDQTGMMGYSYNSDDGPQKCFNAAKNYQLGWYNQQQESYDPLSSASKTFVMNGVANYQDSNSSGKLITLRLINQSLGRNDYYVGYNRASGANQGTDEAANKIVIVRKPTGGPTGGGESWKDAELEVGESFRISNYRNGGSDVIIMYESVTTDKNDATISVTLTDTFECPADDAIFLLELQTDNYGSETSWSLKETSSNTVVAKISPNSYAPNNGYVSSTCIAAGTEYTFTINDAYGDGICCSYGQGEFVGKVNGIEVFRGGTFTNQVVKTFTSAGTTPPMSPLTRSPTKSPTKSPTNLPTHLPTKNPTTPPTLPVGPNICEDNETEFKLKLMIDNYGKETVWKVRAEGDATETDLAGGGPEEYLSNTEYEEKVCLLDGRNYSFIIDDLYGDGLCCNYGDGFYKGYVNNESVFEGGAFSLTKSHTFLVSSKNDEPPPTDQPTFAPTNAPTEAPTNAPTKAPTSAPTSPSTEQPTFAPTRAPTEAPTSAPTSPLTEQPTFAPTHAPTEAPTNAPTEAPTPAPTSTPTEQPTFAPTEAPTSAPTSPPTEHPIFTPTHVPTSAPISPPTEQPISAPTHDPTEAPTSTPTSPPTEQPTSAPTHAPTEAPTNIPTEAPSDSPTLAPSALPTKSSSEVPSSLPSFQPSNVNSDEPSVSISEIPSFLKSDNPSTIASLLPSMDPSVAPSNEPSIFKSASPSVVESDSPSVEPTLAPTKDPTKSPTNSPTFTPTVSPSDLILYEVLPKPITAGKDKDAEYIKLFNPSNVDTLSLGEYQVYDATSNRYIVLDATASLSPRGYYTLCRNKEWFDASSSGGTCDQEAIFNLFDRISTIILQKKAGEVFGTDIGFYTDIDSVQIIDAASYSDQLYSRTTTEVDVEPDCSSCWEWKELQQEGSTIIV